MNDTIRTLSDVVTNTATGNVDTRVFLDCLNQQLALRYPLVDLSTIDYTRFQSVVEFAWATSVVVEDLIQRKSARQEGTRGISRQARAV